jgi:hypothetical protein
MTRKLIVAVAVLALVTTAVFAQQSTRTAGDFVNQAMKTFSINGVGHTPIVADQMDAYYTFYPAMNNGKVVGYLWWGKDFKVAQHFEDLILFIGVNNGKAVLKDFWISHNDHHANLGDAANHRKFAGMTYDSNWTEAADVVSGSTLSSYRIVAEAKPVLFVFQKYVIDAKLLK